MSFKNAKLDNVDCRIMRISFTGEHSYEINIDSNMVNHYGKSAWKQEKNITLHLTEQKLCTYLRAEKGFIIVGQDTDGTMTPIDLQMDWIVSKKNMILLEKDHYTEVIQ